MKKILLVCYGGGHVKIIENIYNSLKDKNYKIIIFALTGAQNYLSSKNIPFRNLEYYHQKFDDGEILNFGENILEELGEDYQDLESKLYYGYSFESLVKKIGKDKSIDSYRNFGRRAFLPVDLLDRIIDEETPDLVITTNAPRMEKAALVSAKKKGIKSISIEDLLGKRVPTEDEIYSYMKDEEYGHIYGDIVCVLSNITKETLLEISNLKEEQIIITGNPNFDSIFRLEKNQDEILPKSICYLSQKTENNIFIFEILLKLLEENKIENLVLKIHPNEKIEEYIEISKKYSKKIIIENNLYRAILKSEVVVTEFSTAGIEAILLGKRVISIRNNELDFSKLGEELIYNTIYEIPQKIEQFFSDEKFKKKNNKFITFENASNNIVKVIEDNI